MKKLLCLMLALVLSLSLIACGGSGDSESSSSQVEDSSSNSEADGDSAEPLRVALCLTGAINDMGWNQSAYEGLLEIEAVYGAEIAYTENLEVADMVAAFTDYAASGYDLVIGHSFLFGDVALEVGPLYPDTKFVAIEGGVSSGDNVASYVMKSEESFYILGIIAASMSESGKIGMIGSVQGPSIIKKMNAFEDGARTINPDIEFSTAWTESFVDTAVAKEAAVAMIENGVDVIAHAANASGNGAILAAEEAGIYAMGTSYDQSPMAPDTIIISDITYVTALMTEIIEDINNGEFKADVNHLGFAKGVISLAPYNNFEDIVPEETKELVAQTVEGFMDGSFEITRDETLR